MLVRCATGCCQASGNQASKALALLIDQVGTYRATTQPITSSIPITFTWGNDRTSLRVAQAGTGGTVGSTTSYSWAITGTYTLTVTATNACGQKRGASPSGCCRNGRTVSTCP